MPNNRFDRQVRFFGESGQASLRASRVAVVGIGGLGSHVVQQLALLGIGGLNLIDGEDLDITNRNRHVGARFDDPIPNTRKVDLGERLALSIDPDIKVTKVADSVISAAGFQAVREADYTIGCVDTEGVRLVLTELCAAYVRPYIDLASDIIPGEPLAYGGQVCCAVDGNGCLVCLGVLDLHEAREDLETTSQRRDREVIYGVRRDLLARSGPSVVSINGLVASLGVTEFMVSVTGIRVAQRLLKYYGPTGKVTLGIDPPSVNCWYCKGVRGSGAAANVERYLGQDSTAPHRTPEARYINRRKYITGTSIGQDATLQIRIPECGR